MTSNGTAPSLHAHHRSLDKHSPFPLGFYYSTLQSQVQEAQDYREAYLKYGIMIEQ